MVQTRTNELAHPIASFTPYGCVLRIAVSALPVNQRCWIGFVRSRQYVLMLRRAALLLCLVSSLCPGVSSAQVTVIASRVSETPLLAPGGSGWMATGVFNPAAIRIGSKTVLLFWAPDANYNKRDAQLCLATSRDLLHWDRKAFCCLRITANGIPSGRSLAPLSLR